MSWTNIFQDSHLHRDPTMYLMHQSIPPAPSPPPRATAGYWHLQMLHCPGAEHLPTPGPIPSFWHTRGFRSEYNYKEGFTGRKADWLICQGQKQIVEGCNGMFSILHVWMHCWAQVELTDALLFYFYFYWITQRELSWRREVLCGFFGSNCWFWHDVTKI